MASTYKKAQYEGCIAVKRTKPGFGCFCSTAFPFTRTLAEGDLSLYHFAVFSG